MTTPRFEHFLASLYVDEDARRRFAADPHAAASGAGLDAAEIEALMQIDRTGLELASRSYAYKRRTSISRDRGWSAKLRSLARSFGLRR